MKLPQLFEEIVKFGDLADIPGFQIDGRELAEGERLMHFTHLVEQVRGDEGAAAFFALIDSIRAPEDFGAYESLHNALWRFPPEVVGPSLVSALPGLIERMVEFDQVERFVCPLAGWGSADYAPRFMDALNAAPPDVQRLIRESLPELMASLYPTPPSSFLATDTVQSRMIPASRIATARPNQVVDAKNLPEALQSFPFLVVVDQRERPLGHVTLPVLLARAPENRRVAQLMRFANSCLRVNQPLSELDEWFSAGDTQLREVIDDDGKFCGVILRAQ